MRLRQWWSEVITNIVSKFCKARELAPNTFTGTLSPAKVYSRIPMLCSYFDCGKDFVSF